ncbi:MAG: tetratricopeptide repeat protein [Candidatus Hodarchaeales archaeon]|jgi:tetratricopeptide (TPR) repeat protein
MALLEEIKVVKELIHQGDFHKALHNVERLEKLENLPNNDQLVCKLLKSTILNKLGDFEASLRLSEQILKATEKLGRSLCIVDALIAKEVALWRLGRYNESLKVVEQGENMITSLTQEEPSEVAQRAASLIGHKGVIYVKKGDLDRALTYFNQNLSQYEEIGNKERIAVTLNNIGNVYQDRGDFDNALEYFTQSHKYFEEIGNKQNIAVTLSNISLIYWHIGDLDQALVSSQQVLTVYKEIGNPQFIASCLNIIGSIYLLKGDLSQALTFFQQSFTLNEEIGNTSDIAMSLNNIGEIYQLKGETEQALTYHKRSLTLREEIGNIQDIAMSLHNIGTNYVQKGDYIQALDNLEQSLKLNEEIGNNYYISHSLFELISAAIDNNNLDKASYYLQKLNQINEEEENKLINQQFRVAEALLLKISTRMTQKAKAQEILQQLVDEEIVDHSLTVLAMLNLCELLLDELKLSGEMEVLLQVKELLTEIHEIGLQQQSSQLIVQSIILKAKFLLIDGDFEDAQDHFELARITADERGLQNLVSKITEEQENLLREVDKWAEMIEKNAPLRDRIKLAKLDEYISEIIHTKSEIPSHFSPFTFSY